MSEQREHRSSSPEGKPVGKPTADSVRVATWNLNWWNRKYRQVDRLPLIDQHQPDVCLLQEVRGKAARDGHEGPSVFSQETFPPANWSWMGCGILLRPGAAVLSHGVINSLPKPQRGLWAQVALPAGPELTVASWHAPNRAGDGLAVKMAAFAAMADWLANVPGPVILGADLNTWTDPIDLTDPVDGDDHWEEHAFVGPDPRHGLIDAFRTLLEESGSLDARRSAGDAGPLAVSYVLSSGVGHRMDRIFASPGLVPIAGDYDLRAARQAGSDHAFHWIDFRLS